MKQRLDEALNQERRALRCELIKKRRELISDMVRRPYKWMVLTRRTQSLS